MHVQIITYQLAGLGEEEFRRHCEQVAPAFGQLPNLISKVWLADPATNTFGGVYTWPDRAAAERYRASDLYRGLVTNPHIANLTDRDFAIMEQPTRATRGLVESTATAG
jgi:hypothetical protein